MLFLTITYLRLQAAKGFTFLASLSTNTDDISIAKYRAWQCTWPLTWLPNMRRWFSSVQDGQLGRRATVGGDLHGSHERCRSSGVYCVLEWTRSCDSHKGLCVDGRSLTLAPSTVGTNKHAWGNLMSLFVPVSIPSSTCRSWHTGWQRSLSTIQVIAEITCRCILNRKCFGESIAGKRAHVNKTRTAVIF